MVEVMSSAFTDQDDLRLMLRQKFRANLDAVAGRDNLTRLLMHLNDWAESKTRAGCW